MVDSHETGRTEELWPTPAQLFAYARRSPLLVLFFGLLGACATLLWLGRQTPQWSAQTTLLVRRPEAPQDAAAAPLHAMAQEVDVASEVAILSSREPAAQTVRGPTQLFGPWNAAQLGLTTQVDDAGLQPLAALRERVLGLERRPGSLRAYVSDAEPNAPRAFRLEMLGPNTVRYALGDSATWSAPISFPHDEPIEIAGLTLWLRPQGEVGGKEYLVTLHEEREAVRSLMERTTIGEVDRSENVVRVTVRDSDPHRAASVANALAANYLAHRRDQARERARSRLDQVEGELRRIDTELREAFEELVLLRRSSPLSIDSETSAKALTLRLTSRGVDYTGAQLELTMLEEGIAALEKGDLEALARLRDQSTDEFTRTLVTHVSELYAQTQLERRSDSAPYRALLEGRELRLRETRDQLRGRVGLLAATQAALEEDGFAALAQLGTGEGQTGSLDASTRIVLETATRLATKRTELLAQDYLPNHPEVQALESAVEEHLAELRRLVASRMLQLRRQLDHAEAMVTSAQEELVDLPQRDLADLEDALTRFREQLVNNLRGLRDGLRRQVIAQATELGSLENQLGELPESERQQLGPRQVVENAKARVAELLETRDMVKMVEAFFEDPAEVVDPATPPARRDTPRTGFSLLLGTLAGLAAGVFAALLNDRFRGRVRTSEEVEQELGLAVLGVLPALRLDARNPLSDMRTAFEVSDSGPTVETFRRLRENLFTLLGARPDLKTIGITSAVDGEGKTTTTLGLALACRRARRRVLIVSAPSTRTRAGLVDVLAGRSRPEKAVVPSGLGGLDLLSAGGTLAALADVSAAPLAARRFDVLVRDYDLVLVDLPSLQGHPETLALARLLSSLLIVCEAGGPTRATVRSMLRLLDRSGLPLLGAVLDQGARRGVSLPFARRVARRRRRRAA